MRLKHIADNTSRAGLQRPTVEVRFENICVTARVLVGEHGRPTLLNYYSSGIAVSIDNCIQRLPDYNVVPSLLEAHTLPCSMSWLPFAQAHTCLYVHGMQAKEVWARAERGRIGLLCSVSCDKSCKQSCHPVHEPHPDV